MSERSPAFQFYPKDWLSDSNVRAMTVDAKGTYIELLCLYWLHGGLPNSTDYLARLVVLPPAKFRRLWPQIAPCFTVDGDQLHQKRMDREREKQDAYRRERSSSGKRGAEKRHGSAIKEPLAKSSSSSAVSVLLSPSPVERTDERSGAPLSGRNPFVTDRPSLEAESLKLTREIAALTGEDGAEIFTRAAHYEGALRQKCNPATMREDRLLLTVQDLRATLKAEQEKRERVGA